MKRKELEEIIDKTYNDFVDEWISWDMNTIEGFVRLPERLVKAIEDAGMLKELED